MNHHHCFPGCTPAESWSQGQEHSPGTPMQGRSNLTGRLNICLQVRYLISKIEETINKLFFLEKKLNLKVTLFYPVTKRQNWQGLDWVQNNFLFPQTEGIAIKPSRYPVLFKLPPSLLPISKSASCQSGSHLPKKETNLPSVGSFRIFF